MSANPGSVDVLEELKAVRRLASVGLIAAAISTVIALIPVTRPTLTLPKAPMPSSTASALPPSTQPPPAPQRTASVVEAERFVVRDKAGRERAEFGVEPDDDTGAELSLKLRMERCKRS
jgi:hypothetical protein